MMLLDTKAFEDLLSCEELDINAQDDQGKTALHRAVQLAVSDQTKAFIVWKLLRQEKIDLNIKDNEGRSARDLAKDSEFILDLIDSRNWRLEEKAIREAIQNKPLLRIIVVGNFFST